MKKIGILDPEGLEINPLTGEDYTPNYRYWVEKSKWDQLPMYTQIPPEKIINSIMTHQVVILESGTGSGKSVLMPKYALHATGYKGNIVITNPKQLPTAKNADFAAKLLDVELGKEVGFQHQGSKLEDGGKSKSTFTKLLFSTDGSVVEVLRNNPSGDNYDIVIIDEAHERNLRIDLILLQMKKALRINPDLKLIVMSATLPGNLFYDYFSEFSIESIEVSGKSNFPVEDHYVERPIKIKDVEEMSVKVLFEEIIDKEKEGDVLIFTVAPSPAEKIKNMIEKRLEKNPKEKAKCYILASGVKDERLRTLAIEKDEYKSEPGGPWTRKIVIGTNQVESSITVDGIVYVIDNGYSYETIFDFSRDTDQLLKERISKASAMQRRGRAGRTQPGECFKLYTVEEEEQMPKDPILAINKEDISGEVFDVFRQKEINNVLDIRNLFDEYIEPPKKESMEYCFRLFKYLGIIDSVGGDGTLTEKGKQVIRINKLAGLNIRAACCLVSSVYYDCLHEVCLLISIINNIKDMNSVFVKYNAFFHDKKKYEKMKKFFSDDYGDLFTIRKIFQYYYSGVEDIKKKGGSEYDLINFCEENFLSYKILTKIREDFVNMFRRSKKMIKLENLYDKDITLFNQILFSMAAGYGINIAKKSGKNFINWYPLIKTSSSLDKETTVPKKTNYVMYIKLKNIAGNKSYSLCNALKKENVENICKEYGLEIVFKEPSKRRSIGKNNTKGNKAKQRKMQNKIKSKINKLRKIKRRKKMNN